MTTSRRIFIHLAAGLGAGLFMRAGRGVDLPDILPAALDQPQINAIVYVGDNAEPQYGQTLVFDPNDIFGTTYDNTFNVTAYLDTGASGILLADSTGSFLNLPRQSSDGQPVLYYDVGVAGSDSFQVSQPLRISLANFYPRTDLDQFQDANHTVPDTTPYTVNVTPPPGQSLLTQIGPVDLSVAHPVTDDVTQLIDELTALDVVGMPAIKGHVMVLDPTRVNNVHELFDGTLNLDNLDNLPDLSMRTYLYSPGTAYHDATKDTDPGIPATQLHVKLSYGSFDQFTTVSPGGILPTLTHNPFIGKDPVAVFRNEPTDDVPGVKITRQEGTTLKSSEGNWLLDTGAAASIISMSQAAAVGVHYAPGTEPGNSGGLAPELVDDQNVPLDEQFTLTIGGIGGQTTVGGFYLDSILVRTMEGSATDDSNPLNLNFTHAAVLVSDVSLRDPVSDQILTLDGVFGMNMFVASASLDDSDPLAPTLEQFSTGDFNWITFDEPNGILGLSIDPASGITLVPEPGTLLLLAGGLLLALRRRTS